LNPWSIIETIPFIVFLYMYQALLPQAYRELKKRSLDQMDQVVISASVAMILVYIVVGLFGYLTFSDSLESNLLS
jgi:amino acid permease